MEDLELYMQRDASCWTDTGRHYFNSTTFRGDMAILGETPTDLQRSLDSLLYEMGINS